MRLWLSLMTPVEMSGIEFAFAALFLAVIELLLAVATRAGLWAFKRRAPQALRKTNYQGTPVVSGAGVVFAAIAVVMYLLAAAVMIPSEQPIAASFALVGIVSGVLGFIDDLRGSRDVGGFRGHFGELRRGRLTTGAAKALILPPATFATAIVILQQSPVSALITTALVSLLANTVNLLDVRPARATTAWLAGAGAAILLSVICCTRCWPIVLLIAPVLAYLPDDAGRRVMLGDVGANFLGAVLGLQLASEAPLAVRLILIGSLLALHWYSESHSLSAEIERRSWLRWLDFFNRPFFS